MRGKKKGGDAEERPNSTPRDRLDVTFSLHVLALVLSPFECQQRASLYAMCASQSSGFCAAKKPTRLRETPGMTNSRIPPRCITLATL